MNNAWILHQDNALALEHSLYFSDLVPCDFHLFPKLKTVLKETYFRSIEDGKTEAADLLKGLKPEALQHCFEQ